MFRSRITQINLSVEKLQILRNSSFKLNSKISSSSPILSIPCRSKTVYRTEPPIDLKKVRTRGRDDGGGEDPQQPNYGFVLLTIPLITLSLGVWQIKRREWKLDLIKFLESRTTLPPKELPTNEQELFNLMENNEFCPYKVKGRFIHSKEILLQPKHDITGTNHLPGGLIITPFVLSGRNDQTILVNRGFVPYTNYSPNKRQEGQIEDEVELVGLLRKDEIISSFTPPNKPPNEWHFREIDLMSKTLNTLPVLLDATIESSVKGGPLGGQTAINLRNEHMNYIVTWFSLTFFTTLLWWQKFGKFLLLKR